MSQRGWLQDLWNPGQTKPELSETSCKEVVCVTSLCVCVFLSCVCVSFPVGGGVGAVREGGGGAPGVRQPSPAADRRPMPRHLGASRQRSGGQLLTQTHTTTQTHTHWEKRPLLTHTKHTKDVSPAVLTCVKRSVLTCKRLCVWVLLSRLHWKSPRVYRLVKHVFSKLLGTESSRDTWPSGAPAVRPAFGIAIRTWCVLWRENVSFFLFFYVFEKNKGWGHSRSCQLVSEARLTRCYHIVIWFFFSFLFSFCSSAAFDSLHHLLLTSEASCFSFIYFFFLLCVWRNVPGLAASAACCLYVHMVCVNCTEEDF